MRLISATMLSGLILAFSHAKDASAQNTELIEFVPDAITRLCPDHRGGDREFEGHGPNVTANANLEIRLNTELWVKLYLHVKETRADWTEAEQTWDRQIWSAPSGYVILGVASDLDSNTFYEDSNHELDRPAVRGGDLVRQFEILGDTGGDDVSHCTDDDVYMNVYFNKVSVVVQRVTTMQVPVSRAIGRSPVGTTFGPTQTFRSMTNAVSPLPGSENTTLESEGRIAPPVPAEPVPAEEIGEKSQLEEGANDQTEANGEELQLDAGASDQTEADGEELQLNDGSGNRFGTQPVEGDNAED